MMKRLFSALLLCLLWSLPAQAANRFATCATTCTWDNSSTAMWGTSTGGTGASAPGSGDAVILDANTCVGGTTCTITVNADVNILSITMSLCTASTAGCVLDFSANNNNPTIGTGGFTNSGTGTNTVKAGNGTWTFAASANAWTWADASGTFTANSSTFAYTGSSSSTRNFTGGGKTYGTLTVAANAGAAAVKISGSNSFAGLSITGQATVMLANGATQTITNLTLTGSSGNEVAFISDSTGVAATVSTSNASSMTWSALRDITFTSASNQTATNSADLGHNTISGGGTLSITPPSATGGGHIIGG